MTNNPSPSLSDLYVLIPGITGSVLEKQGQELWAPSLGVLTRTALGGKNLQSLVLPAVDDPTLDDLDGVVPTRIIDGVTLIPGLHAFDGFARLRRQISAPEGLAAPSSVIDFPYDWRRDNRVAAHRLKKMIEDRLFKIRRSGSPTARAVLLAHSMGGLVARYYLEVLGGWQDCRALVTFGTPHYGSVKVLDYLENGAKFLWIDATELTRSLTSAYQLLPTYPMIASGDTWQSVVDLPSLGHLDHERAVAGRAFHKDIQVAQETNLNDSSYRTEGYLAISVSGTGQPTLQSARLVEGRIEASRLLPPQFSAVLGDGDGTVPRISSSPQDAPGQRVFGSERHSSLQGQADVLFQVENQIRTAGTKVPKILAAPSGAAASGLSLDLEDVYAAGSSAEISVRPLGITDVQEISGELEPLAKDGAAQLLSLEATDEGWKARLSGLHPGSYRLSIQARSGPVQATVQDLFEVVQIGATA